MAPNLSEFHSLTFTVSYMSGRWGLGPAYLPILICHCSNVTSSSESTENINSFFSFSQKPFIPGRNHMWSKLLHGAAMPTCRCCLKAASGGRMSASRNVSGWRRWQPCPVSHRVGGGQRLAILSAFFQTLDTTLGQTEGTLPSSHKDELSSGLRTWIRPNPEQEVTFFS